MNCFYHPTVVAVGTCKSCCKGLCKECAVDLGKGLACKGRCEEDVKAVIGLIERNIKLSPASEQLVNAARSNRYLGAAFYLIFGLLFLVFAAYQYLTVGFQSGDLLLWGMGVAFLIFGLVVLKRALRFSRSVK
jgi:hypothetical protein